MNYLKLTKVEIIKEIKNEAIHAFELPKELLDDKEIVLEIIKKNGVSLAFCTSFKDDKEVVINAIDNNSTALKYALERLKNDIDIVLKVVIKNAMLLRYASENLQNNKDLLEFLEKGRSDILHKNHKKWYDERMNVLNNIREKEYMDKSVNPSNKTAKKVKF